MFRYADNKQVQAFFDASLDAIVGMDSRGMVCAWNQEATRIFGWTAEAAMGKRLSTLIVPERMRAKHEAGLSHFLQTGIGPVLGRRIEIRAVNVHGHELDVELSILPLEIDGEVSFYASIRDITYDKALRENQIRSEREARILSQASLAIAEGDSFENLVCKFLELICSATNWQHGHAYLIDPAQTWAIPTGIWYPANPEMQSELKDFRFKKGEGLPGRVWQSARSEFMPDIEGHNLFPRFKIMAKYGIASAFAFPLFVDNEVVAVLEFFNSGSHEANIEISALTATMGAQLGQIIKIHRQQERNSLLMRESAHRAQNLLAVVQSLFRQSSSGAQNIEALSEKFLSRLQSLARVSRLQLHESARNLGLRQLIEKSIEPFVSSRTLQIDGENIEVSGDVVTTLTIIMHELSTNAIKYGAWSQGSGTVKIEWHVRETSGRTEIAIEWSESGGPPVTRPQRSGFGSTLLSAMVRGVSGRDIEYRFAQTGLHVYFSVPIHQ